MEIQLNASNGIENNETLDRWADTFMRETLDRLRQDITRVEIHLSDENASKAGGTDKRCTMEARLVHHQPLVVHHDAPSQDEAIRGAADKLKRIVTSTVERLRDQTHRGRDSIRKDVPLVGEPDAA